MNRFLIAPFVRHVFAVLLLAGLLFTDSCTDHLPAVPPDATALPGDVITSWLTMQLKLALTAPGSPATSPRRYAYASIAAYESIVPGLPAYQSIAPQLNGLTGLPTVTAGQTYYWPACANAALAAMNRNFYPTTSAANKVSIDSLEAANTTQYLKTRPADELARSADFGKKIAAVVFDWAKTDGNDDATPYTPPVGFGLWVPTPPAFAAAAVPNWGKCRPIMASSGAGADQGPPIAYSESPTSAYYAQAKELYDISQTLTTEQKTIATFWPDNSWHDILNQILLSRIAKLDVAATAFVQVSISVSDAQISLFKSKYFYNGLRPITYIRATLNQPTWNALITTPAHPEYPAGHSTTSGAAAQALTLVFGANYKFTDKPYNLPTFAPRSYNSFDEAAAEAGISRLYAGLHYRKTTEVSLVQGKVIANNVGKLKFKK